MSKLSQVIKHPWRASELYSWALPGPEQAEHIFVFLFLFFIKQVSPVLMGGLQSTEALVVMAADPCPLWINKLTVFMNECGGGSCEASWKSQSVEKYTGWGLSGGFQRQGFGHSEDVRPVVSSGVSFWWWLACVYWLRCCICKTNMSLWPQHLWSLPPSAQSALASPRLYSCLLQGKCNRFLFGNFHPGTSAPLCLSYVSHLAHHHACDHSCKSLPFFCFLSLHQVSYGQC